MFCDTLSNIVVLQETTNLHLGGAHNVFITKQLNLAYSVEQHKNYMKQLQPFRFRVVSTINPTHLCYKLQSKFSVQPLSLAL